MGGWGGVVGVVGVRGGGYLHERLQLCVRGCEVAALLAVSTPGLYPENAYRPRIPGGLEGSPREVTFKHMRFHEPEPEHPACAGPPSGGNHAACNRLGARCPAFKSELRVLLPLAQSCNR